MFAVLSAEGVTCKCAQIADIRYSWDGYPCEPMQSFDEEGTLVMSERPADLA